MESLVLVRDEGAPPPPLTRSDGIANCFFSTDRSPPARICADGDDANAKAVLLIEEQHSSSRLSNNLSLLAWVDIGLM